MVILSIDRMLSRVRKPVCKRIYEQYNCKYVDIDNPSLQIAPDNNSNDYINVITYQRKHINVLAVSRHTNNMLLFK